MILLTDGEWNIWLRYGTPSGRGKDIRFGLRNETGAERITTITYHNRRYRWHNPASTVVRDDTRMHLKVDEGSPKTR